MDALERFETLCRKYNEGNDRQREIILSFFDEDEKKTFLEGCGLYKLFNNGAFYNAVRKSLGEQIYSELKEG